MWVSYFIYFFNFYDLKERKKENFHIVKKHPFHFISLLFVICFVFFFFFLKRLRRLLCAKDAESLLEDDSVLGELVIRRETSRVGRPGGLAALCADLSHGVLLAAITVSKEHFSWKENDGVCALERVFFSKILFLLIKRKRIFFYC